MDTTMLTELKIKHAKPGMHADGAGLYLQVTQGLESAGGHSKSWLFRYQLSGRRRAMGLGPVAAVTAKQARLLADDARRLLAAKIDPIEHRKAQAMTAAAVAAKAAAHAVTFEAAALDYIERERAGWRNAKHAAQWVNTLTTYAFPVLGDMSVADIDDAAVLAVLQPIWLTKTETATRVRSRIELVLDTARAKKQRHGDNPARWKGHLDKLLPRPQKVRPVRHHPALPYARMPAFLRALRGHDGAGALCLEFVILTACRSGEALGARWDEIDTEKAVWVVPATRMKAGREHRVPLSVDALAVLLHAKAIRQGDYVFPGVRTGRPMSDMALTMLLRDTHPGVTVHGFRSSFRDWAAEVTEFPGEMAEMALAHAVGDRVEAAYRRGDMFDRRRQMMAAWAAWCDSSGAAGEG